ncbi:MAG: hypothetical protein AAF467_14460 [Actinomycetota bacterium]
MADADDLPTWTHVASGPQATAPPVVDQSGPRPWVHTLRRVLLVIAVLVVFMAIGYGVAWLLDGGTALLG